MMNTHEIMMKLQKNFINFLVLIILIIVAYKIFVAGQKKVEDINAETQVALQKNAVLTQISQSERRLKNLNRQIVNKDKNALLPTLNAVAKDCQVKIIAINRLPIDDRSSGYSKYPFSLNIAVDNYHALGKFISAVESHPFLFSIDSMRVSPSQEGQSSRYKLQVAIDISAILIKE